MNDIKRLLTAALNEEPSPMTVDPADDLARGRRSAARRRRTAIAGGVAAAALLVGGGAWATVQGSDDTTNVATTVVRETTAPPAVQQVTLVAYTGEQPKGYKVARVPDGWEIQGGREASLVLAPKGFADQNVDSFAGKLTVLSTSSDTPPAARTEGTKVPVGDVTGYYREPGDGYQILTYQDSASGRWVDVQAPKDLRWDAARLAEFATGITVVGGAGDSHG